MSKLKKLNIFTYLFLAVLVLAFFLRFYKLGEIPNGLSQDETSIGYNAYSILTTGRDEHGIKYPQNFKAFGEYKLPGYIYASVLPVKFFGLNAFGIRFISALSGFLTVILIYLLADALFANRRIALLSAFLLSINPWHLFFSRAAFEVTLAVFFIAYGVLLFTNGLRKKSNCKLYLSLIFFVLSMYTYNIARLFTPLFGLFLIISNFKQIKSKTTGFFLISLLILIISLLPFVIGLFSTGGANSIRSQYIFTSAQVQSQILEFRSYFINWPPIISKIFFNYWILTIWQYINNVVSYLSGSFFFVSGSRFGNSSIGTAGQWYLLELPAIILGIWLLINRANRNRLLILGWISLVIAVASMTREAPQATRSFILVIPVTLLSAFGFDGILEFLRSIRPAALKISVFSVLYIAVFYSIFLFFASYFVRFPIYYAADWRTGDRDVALFLKIHANEYDRIIFDSGAGFMYSSLLVYDAYPPAQFAREAKWAPDDSEGFSKPVSFGKYTFRQINWEKDLKLPKTLIITNAKNKPNNVSASTIFFYPERPVVLSVGQNIVSYPFKDVAYELISTNQNP